MLRAGKVIEFIAKDAVSSGYQELKNEFCGSDVVHAATAYLFRR
jgi:hypothetical protein